MRPLDTDGLMRYVEMRVNDRELEICVVFVADSFNSRVALVLGVGNPLYRLVS